MTTAGLLCLVTGIMLLFTYIIYGDEEIICGQCGVTKTPTSADEKEGLLDQINAPSKNNEKPLRDDYLGKPMQQ